MKDKADAAIDSSHSLVACSLLLKESERGKKKKRGREIYIQEEMKRKNPPYTSSLAYVFHLPLTHQRAKKEEEEEEEQKQK